MLTGGSKTVKYLLFTFNLLFVITGVALLSLGVVIKAFYREYESLLDDRYLSAPSLLITSGLIIFFIAFFGCCGAAKENYCMVLTFSVLLGAIFVMEIVAGITGYVLSDETETVLSTKLVESMAKYNQPSHLETTKLWDTMQSSLHCCGARNYTDWSKVFNETNVLPMSCCDDVVGAVGNSSCTINSKSLYQTPCIDSLGDIIRGKALTLGGVAIGIAFVQLIGIVFACSLARAIKSSSYESV